MTLGYNLTYKQRPLIKLAPDAVILINGLPQIEICSKCHAKIRISDYITNVSTSLSNNTTVGTASFTLAMPRHGHYGNYMVRGGKVFGIKIMDEIEIYIKARFSNQKGEYKYYKSFWGILTTITEAYSDGVQTVHVQCESIMKWLQIMNTNEHPALLSLLSPDLRGDMSVLAMTGFIFGNLNPYQIIDLLVRVTYLNIMVPNALDLEKISKSSQDGYTLAGPSEKFILSAWQDKFKKIKSSLRMYALSSNTSGETVNKDKEGGTSINPKSTGVKIANSADEIYWDPKAMLAFRPFFRPEVAATNQLNLIVNTYKNNLELAAEVKLFTGFEFYLDTNGELIFKPPFWNLDTRLNPICNINENEILNWEFSESESEIKTRMDVVGVVDPMFSIDNSVNARGIYTDWNLAAKYGLRNEQIQGRFFVTKEFCYYHAMSELDRINARRYRGTLTIVGRPEMRLGFPLYIASRDCFVYPENIAHNFTFGGPFTTVITFNAVRSKYITKNLEDLDYQKVGNNDISLTYKGSSKLMYFVKYDPSLYTEPAKAICTQTPEMTSTERVDITNIISQFSNANKNLLLKNQEVAPITYMDKNVNKLFSDYPLMQNNTGTYKVVDWADSEAKKFLQSLVINSDTGSSANYLKLLQSVIILSDENGYELIGNFENGRSLYLDKNFVLQSKPKSNNIYTPFMQNLGVAIDSFQYNVSNDPITEENTPEERNKSLNNFITNSAVSLSQINPEQVKVNTQCTCQDPIMFDIPATKSTKNLQNN